MLCQIHATRSIRDSRGKNYRSVATVTPRMQKTPCRGSKKNGDLWDLILKNRSSDEGKGGREGGVKGRKKDCQWKREKKKRDSNTVWGKRREEGEKRGKAWLAAIGSSASDNLGHFCHCISIRRAETPHLPFISFPFKHLQAICILSVLPLPFISPHATTFPEW